MEFFVGSEIEIFVRLAVAMVLGVILGLERTYAHKTAGMRTYGLVALAAALFVILGQEAIRYYDAYNFDPMRIASQVVVGVGFLGGGMIILRENTVANITTAAGIWVSAGIGMSVGFGMYSLAIFATLLTLFVLEVLALLEKRVKKGMKEKHQ